MKFLVKQLDENYLIESKESIENKTINVYKYMNNSTTIDPETFVQLNEKQENDFWDLFSVQRDQKFRQGQFGEKNTSNSYFWLNDVHLKESADNIVG